MITLTREEAQQVPLIEQLESVPEDARMIYEHSPFESENIPIGALCREAAKALRAKLSEPTIDGWPLYSGLPQPEPEPVAYMDSKGHLYNSTTHPENYTPLYTASPQREWVGLTDEERANCSAEAYGRHFVLCELIEAKLKEKNT
jgi:hypothetical protein